MTAAKTRHQLLSLPYRSRPSQHSMPSPCMRILPVSNPSQRKGLKGAWDPDQSRHHPKLLWEHFSLSRQLVKPQTISQYLRSLHRFETWANSIALTTQSIKQMQNQNEWRKTSVPGPLETMSSQICKSCSSLPVLVFMHHFDHSQKTSKALAGSRTPLKPAPLNQQRCQGRRRTPVPDCSIWECVTYLRSQLDENTENEAQKYVEKFKNPTEASHLARGMHYPWISRSQANCPARSIQSCKPCHDIKMVLTSRKTC